MIYQLLADLLLVIHLLFILFVVFGGLLVLWRKWVLPVHLLSAAWGASIEFFGWVCPITPLENQMRALSGQAGYSGGFIEHYLVPIIYPEQITAAIQFGLGMLVIITNVVIYFVVVKRIRERKRLEKGSY